MEIERGGGGGGGVPGGMVMLQPTGTQVNTVRLLGGIGFSAIFQHGFTKLVKHLLFNV